MHMKVPIKFLHIMPLDSQSCSPSAHSSRSRKHLLKMHQRRKKENQLKTAHSIMLSFGETEDEDAQSFEQLVLVQMYNTFRTGPYHEFREG